MAVQIPISVDVRNADKAGRDLDKIGKEVVDLGKDAENTSAALKSMLAQTAAFAGISLGAAGLKEFGSKLIDVRKEMQKYQTSLNVLLGDQAKANAMFAELKDFAATTPLMFKDLAAGAQTMLGFNIAAEKVVPMLKAIGDISMGDSQKFNSLTLAFSQMSATGKLMGQDLLQMINAGFNPLMEISRKTGKSISDLKDEMSNGATSAQMVADAFMSATQEGGQFYGMIEAQGKTLAGQINTLKGAIDDMFNTLGAQSEGIIGDTVALLTELVKNYEKVGTVIMGLVGTYGAYQTAVWVVTAAEKGHATATYAAAKAQALLNSTMLANPYVAAAVALGALVTAIVAFSDDLTMAEKAQRDFNEQLEENARLENERKRKVDELISVLYDETEATASQQKALNELREFYPEIFDQYDIEHSKLDDILSLKKQIAEEDARRAGLKLDDDIAASRANIDRLKNGGATFSERMGGVGAAVRKENEKLDLLLREKGKQVSEQFISSLSELSNEQLDTYISELSRRAKNVGDDKRIRMKLPTNQNGDLSEEIALSGGDIRSLIGIVQKKKEQRNAENQAEVETKETLEKKKKAKEVELAKLSEVAALGKEGDTLRKEIAEYDRRIEKAYGTKKTTKKDHKNEDEEKLGDLIEQQQRDKERAAYDQEFATEQARINGLRDGSAKVLAQIELDYEKEKEAIVREEQDLLKSREDAAKKLWEAENTEKVRKGATWQSSGELAKFRSNNKLTDQDKAYFEQRRKTAKDIHDRGIEDQQIADDKYMLDYLQKYGTLQQKREAVTADYQNRINKAMAEGNEWLAKDLAKQMRDALSNLDMDGLKLNINWEAVFGDLSKYTNSQLKTLRDQLNTYKLSDNYVKGTEENKKVIDEAIRNVENSIISSSGIFGGLSDAMTQLSDAQKELAAAEKEVIQTAFDEDAHAAALKRRSRAKQGVENAEANLRGASKDTVSYIGNLASTITQLGTSSEMTVSDLGNLATSIASAFGEAGQKIGGIIGAIFAVAEMIAKDGIKGLFENIGKLVGGVVGGLFGFDINESQHRYEKEKKINDNYIQILNDVIGKQEDLMKRQSAMEVAESVKKIDEDYVKIQELALENVENYLNAGASNGFLGIGSSASYGTKLRKELLSGYDKGFFELLGIDKPEYLKQYEDIFGEIEGRTLFGQATVEQVKAVSESLELWSKLPDEVREYYTQILKAQDALDKMTETTNEMVTGLSFDSLHDSYIDSLMDMDKETRDFADDFSKYMMKAALDSKIKEGLDSQLMSWQTEWQKRMTDDNRLDDNDINVLRGMWDDIIEQGVEIRDNIAKVTGYGSTQTLSATQRSVASTSEETASELNGRFTAIQISNQEISNKTSEAINNIIAIGSSLSDCNAILNDINLAILAGNGYLAQIYAEMMKGFQNSYERMGEFIVTLNTRL